MADEAKLTDALKGLRRQWRRSATRRNTAAASAGSDSWRERCYGEANVYEMCANELDALVRARDEKEGEG